MPTLACPNEFAFCKSFNCDLIAAAMECGFLPMSCSLDRAAFGGQRHVFLAKNHRQRCVINLDQLKARELGAAAQRWLAATTDALAGGEQR